MHLESWVIPFVNYHKFKSPSESTYEAPMQAIIDLSTIAKLEVMASSFGLCGSIVLTDEPVDIDGMCKVSTFYEKYVNPPINLEGKTTEVVAWGLAQVLKLRELVPQGCSIEDIAINLPSAMTLFYADSGIENFGDWKTARAYGEGGVFKILFCKKDSSGVVIENHRLA